ncbi:large subunit GTPase 1 homolog [Plakobranchus ocellatus]|uniref:Large subunit GTPase 1 homolog n=1 Tax=Plakobranchus ocellatus TaxID=259542 RepID=A0AAV4A1Z8_9GAST|nr:large subunit GTPase 1 homolog [Plakobranchus ocellatus]
MIPQPSVDDQSDRLPTAEELLFAYAGMRGFMTPRGIPDAPRASRYILKDYVRGKLLYCEPPPGLDGAEFQDKDRVTKLEMNRTSSKLPPPQINSAVDKDFFAKASHQGIQHLIKSAEREALLCGDATVNMTDLPDTYASVDTDMIAYELMRRHDIRGRPLLTPGD